MRPITSFCALLSLSGIALNLLFLLVTRIQRIERVQEVLVFLRSISVGYILVALAIMAVAPQSITLTTTTIRVPHGLLIVGNAGVSSNFMNGLAAFGVGCFLFTALSFCLLFLYHYRKTAGQMSTVFAPKNVPVFLGVALVFCLVQAVLLFYSKVDPNYLLERLSRSKKWEDVQLSMGLNPNSTMFGEIQGQGGGGGGNSGGGGGGGGGGSGGGGAVSGGFQTITGGSNYSTLNAAIESRVYDTQGGVSGGGGGGGGSGEARMFEGTFGTDYARNPLYFLANGVLFAALFISSLVTVLTSLAVKCKLRGKQESMSDKSQEEMQIFTHVLMLQAYIPTLLVACAGANYLVCFLMGESVMPFQEFLSMLLIAPTPVLFPLCNLLLLKEFRHIACQILLCKIWTRKQRQQRAAAERKAQENIDDELASASRNKARNKRMPNPETGAADSGNGAGAKSTGNLSEGATTNATTKPSSRPEEQPGRYAAAQNEAHREARVLFGKQ